MALAPAFLDSWTPRVLSILRIVTGYMFMLHGTQKLLGFPPGQRPGTVDLMSLSGVAGMLELVGGALLLIGLFTRPVAFILSGEMAFAYFIGHAGRGNPLMPITNGGELAVEWCFVFLFFAVAGAGPWSLDNALFRRRALP
jgi:putative oxidoreductase